MAVLPSAGSESTIGVLITTTAEDGALKTTQAELSVLDDTTKKVGTSASAATSSFDKFNSGLKNFGSQTQAVGRSLSTYVTAPIVAIGAESVKMAMTFQQSMTYVRTDAGDTTDNIAQLSQQVLQLAKNSQFSPDELANGLYHLASLGLRGADAMNALNTAQEMASVGGSDLESTASALGGALVTGIKGVQDYSQAAGVLDATIGAGNMRMQDLVNAIGTGVLPVFKNAGLNITEFGAALATLTDNGQDAAAAATHLRMTIALMEAPSGPAQKALAAIGMTADQMAMDMQTKGLIPALDDLQQHLIDTYGTTDAGKARMAAALNEMFGGGRSSAAIQTLLDQMTRLQTKETQIGQQSGEFSTKYAEQQQTAAAKFKTAWDSVQSSMIQLGDAVMPDVANALTDVSHAVGDVTNWFDHLSGGQKQFVIDAAMVAAATGPVLFTFGSLAKSLNEILTLSKKVGTALGLLDASTGAGGAEKAAGGLIGRLIGGAGGVATAEEAGGALTALAGVLSGPLTISLLGAGAAGLSFYELWRHLGQESDTESQKMAKNVAGWNQWATSMNFTKAAEQNVEGAHRALDTATTNLTNAQNKLNEANKNAKQYTDLYQAAQAKLNTDIEKYGADSPQVQKDQQLVNKYSQESAYWINQASANQSSYNTALGKYKTAVKNNTEAMQQQNNLLQGMVDKVSYLKKNSKVTVVSTLKVGTQLSGIRIGNTTVSQGTTQLNLVNALFGGSSGSRVQSTGNVQFAGNMQVSGVGVSLQGGHASGVLNASAGYSVVGENGPEVMYIPQGADILTNSQSRSLLGSRPTSSGPSGGITLNQTNNIYNQVDMAEADRQLAWQLSTAVGA